MPKSKGKKINNILIVDRGNERLEQFRRVFNEDCHRFFIDRSLQHAFERFEEETFDILALCSSLVESGEIAGLELLEVIAEKCAATQTIFLAFPKDISLAVSALKAGIYQYAVLPVTDNEMRLLVETALDQRPQYAPNLLLRKELQQTTFEDMIGGSFPMREIYRQIRQAASTDMPVLISGETGTGKDLVAKAIHQLSPRNASEFVPINLSALPPELVASELFGHEKGAFTGAWKRYKGSFERAHGGTVFLDEIGTLDEKTQISLLRLLETSKFQRIGSSKLVAANVRIISATNENLTEAVEENRFREDLFYRLEVFHISLPAVRNRPGDKTLLVNYYLKRFNDAYQRNILGISPDCIAALESYDWPGNVREIKNVIHRAVVMCPGETILPEHLPKRLMAGGGQKPLISMQVGASFSEMEREMIVQTLKWTKNNKKKTALMLGISRRALYNKIDKYKIR